LDDNKGIFLFLGEQRNANLARTLRRNATTLRSHIATTAPTTIMAKVTGKVCHRGMHAATVGKTPRACFTASGKPHFVVGSARELLFFRKETTRKTHKTPVCAMVAGEVVQHPEGLRLHHSRRRVGRDLRAPDGHPLRRFPQPPRGARATICRILASQNSEIVVRSQ